MALELDREAKVATFGDEVTELRIALQRVQHELRSAPFSVLILLGGDDAPAAEAGMRVLNEWMDPRNLRILAFDRPTDDERAHPAFWRFWGVLPPRGSVSLFLGGWTVNAAADRLEGALDRRRFERVLEQIRVTERMLAEDGTLVLKFWFRRDGEKRGRRERIFDGAREGTDSDEAPWRLIERGKSRKSQVALARSIILSLSGRLASSPERHGPVEARTLSAPPSPTVLDAVDLTRRYEKADYQQKLDRWRDELRQVTRRARQEGVASVLVFEGWDAAGKGGVIRRLSAGLDPPSYRVVPVAAPSDEDLAHHYLWRFWRHLPAAGRTTIFDRSWYGRVLVERVEGLAHEEEWGRAYDEINEFETGLVESGVLLLKFWLHVDPEEQLRRFREREQTPYKKYKITADDYRNRERWNDYLAAVDEMVSRTSRPEAPWEIVPANDKRWARVRVIKTVCKKLRGRLS